MTHLQAMLEAHLRHAVECYGPDLPLPLPLVTLAADSARGGPMLPPSGLTRTAAAPATAAAPTADSSAASSSASAAPCSTRAGSTAPAGASKVPAARPVVPAADDARTGAVPAGPPRTAAHAARAARAEDGPERLTRLRDEVLACTRCKLCHTRTTVVFGEGDPHARVMFIGEAPGFQEDQQGRPFVGPAGQLLNRIIQNAMGLRREQVFIANVNKCRPPENREPEPDEVAACLPYLQQQVRAIAPQVIVTLGRVATQNLLSVTQGMGALRGRELSFEGIPVVATWHPAYLLRNPAAKPQTWVDIKRVNRLLGRPEVPPQSAADQEASP